MIPVDVADGIAKVGKVRQQTEEAEQAAAAAEAAKASGLKLLDWSSGVLTGDIPARPGQIIAALGVLVRAGEMDKAVANRLIDQLVEGAAVVSELGQQRLLGAPRPA